jgi:hypothetical protein
MVVDLDPGHAAVLLGIVKGAAFTYSPSPLIGIADGSTAPIGGN